MQVLDFMLRPTVASADLPAFGLVMPMVGSHSFFPHSFILNSPVRLLGGS
jgi:hypothetical protein